MGSGGHIVNPLYPIEASSMSSQSTPPNIDEFWQRLESESVIKSKDVIEEQSDRGVKNLTKRFAAQDL